LRSTHTNGTSQSNPEWFGVIYRELIPQGLFINETNAARYGMKPSQVYKKSILDAREVMCPPDKACEYVPVVMDRFPASSKKDEVCRDPLPPR
jgi:hypothetical protein